MEYCVISIVVNVISVLIISSYCTLLFPVGLYQMGDNWVRPDKRIHVFSHGCFYETSKSIDYIGLDEICLCNFKSGSCLG